LRRIACAAKRTLHLIVNNYAAHKCPTVLHWLARRKAVIWTKDPDKIIDAVKRGRHENEAGNDARRCKRMMAVAQAKFLSRG